MLLLFAQPNVAVAATQSNNKYPVVLVHGFAGWGNDEMLGYNYWGGFADVEKVMTNAGLKTYAVAVGPFSSNWDRTCELYAYIMGGTVDYGKAHSEKYGHARYGRTYPGIYKDWGKTVGSKVNKIHLVGHSMGGQTARMLVQLLEQGSQEEKAATPENLSPLFKGGNSWVHSVTTIATPNDGTTMADQTKLLELAKSLLSAVGAIAGIGNGALYDFKLDQWGLKRNANESYSKYAERVWKSPIWSNTKDFSTWDLSTDGAQELNSWVKAQPNVYYFSWATCSTHKALLSDKHLPNLSTTIVFYPTALLMGSYTRKTSNRPVIDKKWFPNDGVVNTVSQNGPKLGSKDMIVNYNGKAQSGKWNYMGLLDNTDHINSVGHLKNVNSFYKALAVQLAAIPA
ncbi:MAG: lipase [Clostridia bacterium]|nr:lipase [Clostridia bacterium]